MKLNNHTINDEIESGNIFSNISDHLPNFIMIKSDKNSSNKSDENKRPFIRLQGITNVTNSDPNITLDMINTKYSQAYERSFPLVMISRKRIKDKKWITPGIRISINQKAYLYRTYLNYPTERNKTIY